MTRKWADQQEYVTRWKYVGAVPTFPQIRPTIIIESWICIWSRLTTSSLIFFSFYYLSHFYSTGYPLLMDNIKIWTKLCLYFSLPSKFPFPYTLNVCTVLMDDNTILISFVSFWWHGGPYNDLLVSHHIACFLHVVLFASFQNWIL